jgi:hypothetical protein
MDYFEECVKGVKQLGMRAGSRLNLEQAPSLLAKSDGEGLRSGRDLATISVLPGGRLRRGELLSNRTEAPAGF